MNRRPRLPPSSPFSIYEDDQDANQGTGSESTESSSSANSSVPEHHRAVASTPHPMRRTDGRPQPSFRALRTVQNDENVRQGAISNSSNSASTRTGRSSSGGSSSSSSATSVGSSLFYHPSSASELMEFPTSPSQPYYYERENLYPAPPDAMMQDSPSGQPVANQNAPPRPMLGFPQSPMAGPQGPHCPERRSHRDLRPDGYLQPLCRPPGGGGGSNPPPGPPPTGLRVRPGSSTGGLSVRPTSDDDSADEIGVYVVRENQRPAKTKVAIKLKSLRVIVNELADDDDEVIVVMTVPTNALIEDESRLTRPRPSSRRPPPHPRRKKSKKIVNRNVPE